MQLKFAKMGAKAQLSMEGIFAIILGFIIYLILAGMVFNPLYAILSPFVSNGTGTYGTTALTLILVGIFIFIPVLLLAGAAQYLRPPTQIRQ